jgi:hypothetical protein
MNDAVDEAMARFLARREVFDAKVRAGKPFLVYTNSRGWMVAVPNQPDRGFGAHFRPGGGRVPENRVRAVADLPPSPE